MDEFGIGTLAEERLGMGKHVYWHTGMNTGALSNIIS